MKRTTRFAIAKYVPDLQRMEPLNLGVVLWGEGGVAASRFLGEQDDGTFRVPAVVEKDSRYAYRQWIAYWRHQLAAPQIAARSGSQIPRTAPEFFDALLDKSKEQFRLVESGHFTEKLSDREVKDTADDLFARLVERPSSARTKTELAELLAYCKQLFAALDAALQRDLPVPRHVLGVHRTFFADYAIGPVGKPLAVCQRVLLSKRASVDSTAFMFQALRQDSARPLRKEACASLITTSQRLDAEGRTGLQMLENISTVIDVSQPAVAIDKLRHVVAVASESN